MHYIHEDSFFAWYTAQTGRTDFNREALLDEVFRGYVRTGRAVFVLSGDRTVSGHPAEYPFQFEDTGCCGASTRFITF